MAKLQDERTVQKICVLDNHVMMAFAGLTADARIIIKKARQVRQKSFTFLTLLNTFRLFRNVNLIVSPWKIQSASNTLRVMSLE